jgi:hypothetical protein
MCDLEMPQTCLEFCTPLVPNGCDCFGCCQIHVGGEIHTVYIGTEVNGQGTCNVETAGDHPVWHRSERDVHPGDGERERSPSEAEQAAEELTTHL